MFEPVDGRDRYVLDPETGVVMFIKNTPELQSLEVSVKFPSSPEIKFGVGLEPKYPDRPFVPNDLSNPMIQLSLGSLQLAVRARPGSYDENSRFVLYLLSGLSVINRKWPLCGNPFFYSDLDDYAGRENIFPFSFPSNEEIAKL